MFGSNPLCAYELGRRRSLCIPCHVCAGRGLGLSLKGTWRFSPLSTWLVPPCHVEEQVVKGGSVVRAVCSQNPGKLSGTCNKLLHVARMHIDGLVDRLAIICML